MSKLWNICYTAPFLLQYSDVTWLSLSILHNQEAQIELGLKSPAEISKKREMKKTKQI